MLHVADLADGPSIRQKGLGGSDVIGDCVRRRRAESNLSRTRVGFVMKCWTRSDGGLQKENE